jgi:integrase
VLGDRSAEGDIVPSDDFKNYCVTALNLSKKTAKEHWRYARRFLEGFEPSKAGVIAFLSGYNSQPSTKANVIKALRRYFRDYLRRPELVEGLVMPRGVVANRLAPSKEDLIRFHGELPTEKDRAIFLLLASSGMRRMEVMTLTRSQLDLERGVVVPTQHIGNTKRDWLGFFNREARAALEEYLASRGDGKDKLFPSQTLHFRRVWMAAGFRSRARITPKVLRFWFCCEMGNLDVQERYIDAFCGRIPRSVLARHYTDYSYGKMKVIYDRAGLRVLG